MGPYTALFADDVVRIAPPNPGAHVLDVAAGSGSLTGRLSLVAARVTAIDLSRMVASLHSRFSPANVTAQVMDAEALAFADATFDGVYSLFGVLFCANVVAALRELVRVAKTGTRCVIATWAGPEKSRLLAPIAAAFAALLPDSPAHKALSAPPPLSDPTAFRDAMRACGLTSVAIHEVAHPFRIVKESYLNDFPRANPAGIEMQRRLPPELFARLHARIAKELDTEFSGEDVALPGVANIAVGTKR